MFAHPGIIRGRTVSFSLFLILSTFVATFTAIAPAMAHDVALTEVDAVFRGDNTFVIQVRYDVDAHLTGVRPEHITADDLRNLLKLTAEERSNREAELRDMLRRRIRVQFDGTRVEPDIRFVPSGLPVTRGATQPVDATTGHASRVETIVELTGTIPHGAMHFEFWASRSFGTIVLQAGREGGERSHDVIEPGAGSKPINVSGINIAPSHIAIGRQYVILGFEHILPKGLDHILFVVGLFLFSTKLGPLLWQVTAFTLAHTLTLALSMYGVVSLPSSVVEPLIALSIACIAIENIFTTKLHVWRPAIVFGFGLLHGMGFAGVLMELGLPRERFATALISFNVGVELGQLAVIAMAFALVGWWRNRATYRRRLVVPASAAIACIGLYWTIERIL